MSYRETNYRLLLLTEEFRVDCSACKVKDADYLAHTFGCLGTKPNCGMQRGRRRFNRMSTGPRSCSNNPFEGKQRRLKIRCLEIRKHRPVVRISEIPMHVEDVILDMVTDMNILSTNKRARYYRKRIFREIMSDSE